MVVHVWYPCAITPNSKSDGIPAHQEDDCSLCGIGLVINTGKVYNCLAATVEYLLGEQQKKSTKARTEAQS